MKTKTESEIRAKLDELLAIDSTHGPDRNWCRATTLSKVAACKALLWALGENDEDRWHITAKPGPPVDARAKARN